MSREAHTAALPRGWGRHLLPLAAIRQAKEQAGRAA